MSAFSFHVKAYHQWISRLVAALTVVIVGIHAFDTVFALEPVETWTPPQYLGMGALPTMAVDSEAVLHLIWVDNLTEEEPIYTSGDTLLYSRFVNGEWAEPVDVLAVPAGRSAAWPDLIFGPDGRLHVFWVSNNRLEHASALPAEAGSARAWRAETTPAYFHLNATTNWPYDVAVDASGVFHCIAVDIQGDSWALKYSFSTDAGHSWSPSVLAVSATLGSACTLPRLAVSGSGNLHLTWSELQLPEGWPPVGVFYSGSSDSGSTWSTPLRLSEPNESYSNLVAVGEDEVHVVWNATNPPGRFHRWTRDEGQNWTDIVKISSASGMTQGPPTVAADSARRVHFAGFGTPSNDSSEQYHLWDGAQWSAAFLLSPGESGVYTGYPTMLCVQGNEIHVAWSTWDPSEFSTAKNRHGIWYRRLVTSAPRVEGWGVPKVRVQESASAEKVNTITPALVDAGIATPIVGKASVSPSSELTLTVTRSPSFDADFVMRSSQTPILMGLVPVVALIALVILVKSIRKRG